MGFFKTTKKVGKVFFNFQVGNWLGFKQIKSNAQEISDNAKRLLTPEQASHNETFANAVQRLKLSTVDLQQRYREFKRLCIFFVALAATVFSYSVYIAVNGNFFGFLMGFSLTLYALTQAFKYHFWMFQIRTKKLGCSIKEWFNANI
ncbi:MAG: phosphoesterase [Thiotrichales bacterium]|nr:MAG: phosphoesterase [Thiotrichales bacterium]